MSFLTGVRNDNDVIYRILDCFVYKKTIMTSLCMTASFGRSTILFCAFVFGVCTSAHGQNVDTIRSRIQHTADSSLATWADIKMVLLREASILSSARRERASVAASVQHDSVFGFVARRLAKAYRTHDSLATRNATRKLSSQNFFIYAKENLNAFRTDVSQHILQGRDSLTLFVEMLYDEQRNDTSTVMQNLVLESYDSPVAIRQKSREPTHTFTVSYGYDSRVVWRGLVQNGDNGAQNFSIDYMHKWGFTAAIGASDLFGSTDFIDQYTISIGYQRRFFENLNLNAAYSYYQFPQSSQQIRSAITSDVSASASYDNDYVVPTVSFTYSIPASDSADGDIYASFELARSFDFEKFLGGSLSLTPSVLAEYGTVNAVTVLINQRRRRAETSSAFAITDYMFSLSVMYSYRFLSFLPSLSYVIPMNTDRLQLQAAQDTPPSLRQRATPLLPPTGNVFYFSLGAMVSF
jgi:hypothetical protein